MRDPSWSKPFLAILAVLALVLATGAAVHAQPIVVGDNVQVNSPQQFFPDGLIGRSGTALASDPSGQNLVAAWQDSQGFCGPPIGVPCTPQSPPGLTGWAYSTDGGATWTDGGGPPVVDHVLTGGHPWLERGGVDNRTFYLANRAIHDQVRGAAGLLGVSIHRGHFEGDTFMWDDLIHLDEPTPNEFYSRQGLAAAKDGSGLVVVSLTNSIELCGQPFGGFGQIELYRSPDGGDTWLGPVIVSPDATYNTDPNDPDCGTVGPFQISSSPAIGPDGEVYVAWQFGPDFTPPLVAGTIAQIRVGRSLDGGATFDAPVTVAEVFALRHNPPVGYNKNRFLDFPRIAVAQNGPYRGRVYLTYNAAVSEVDAGFSEPSEVSNEAFLVYSDDQGLTWSDPVPVDDPVPPTGIKRIWPQVSVQPGGVVDVTYVEVLEAEVTPTPGDIECEVNVGNAIRSSTFSSLADTYVVRSTDGGDTFGDPVRVTEVTSNWCEVYADTIPNFGDYLDALSLGNRTLVLWTDGRSGTPNVTFATVDGVDH